MTPAEAQKHIEDMKHEISWLLFHKQSLIREMELLKPKVESKIVKPMVTSNLNNVSAKDLETDLVAPDKASMELILTRKAYFYAMNELADTMTAIQTKEEMMKTYIQHISQELNKQNKAVSDQMIFDAFRKAQALGQVSDAEKDVISNIGKNLLSMVNSSKERRIEVLETLQNIILQHNG